MERCEILGRISEKPDLLVRPFGSEAMEEVNELVADWMRDAGMAVRQDAIGNLIRRYEGQDEGTLVLGSHLDTVRDAGKYDGPLGVLVALACVERLHERGEHLPFAVEVVAFADEEGLRFGTTYLGSSVFAGTFDPELLRLEDANHVSLAKAVRAFGGDPDALTGGPQSEDLVGYCEVHIEQGPVLEERGLPVGVVSAITGQSRIGVEFVGEAGHAGTVPMDIRRDALCAAAEFILAVERLANDEPGLVATVGEIVAEPGASNVIPGRVTLSLDVRHQEDTHREQACRTLRERAGEISNARHLDHHWNVRQESPAVSAAPDLTALLARTIEERGLAVEHLPSGAGHDAAAMAAVAPWAMLFVRCRDGISHHPDESVEPEDTAVALEVMSRFLTFLADEKNKGGKVSERT
jgi:allantoate deiminase